MNLFGYSLTNVHIFCETIRLETETPVKCKQEQEGVWHRFKRRHHLP